VTQTDNAPSLTGATATAESPRKAHNLNGSRNGRRGPMDRSLHPVADRSCRFGRVGQVWRTRDSRTSVRRASRRLPLATTDGAVPGDVDHRRILSVPRQA
jgi:hypothetical protein